MEQEFQKGSEEMVCFCTTDAWASWLLSPFYTSWLPGQGGRTSYMEAQGSHTTSLSLGSMDWSSHQCQNVHGHFLKLRQHCNNILKHLTILQQFLPWRELPQATWVKLLQVELCASLGWFRWWAWLPPPQPTHQSGLQSLSWVLPSQELLLHNDAWADKGL